MAPPSSARVFAVLAAGVAVMSTASILIRWLQAAGVPSLSIAAWRLGLAALILAPLVLARHRAELGRLAPRDWLLAAAAGAFLAAHFASWILSLEYTSVAASVALVTTNPIWIGVASWAIFRERLAGTMVAAIALAIAGSAVIFLADAGGSAPGRSPVLGNMLAVVGSLTICGYLLIGRGLRRSVSLVPYVGVVYAAAAVCLFATASAAGAPLAGFSTGSWLLLAALAVGPQLLGHSSFNWALKYLSATLIALAILGEPIGSSILAWWLLREPVGAVELAGMALLLTGIFLAARAGGK